jgi:predicted lipoprotein with Yx(FWY)xxD motif
VERFVPPAQSIPVRQPYIHLETRDHEETDDMERTRAQHATTWQRSLRRLAALALALGGLSAVAIPAMASAATDQTATEISSVKNAKLGTILVAGDTAVYTLKGGKCSASCQKSNPPVLLPDGVDSATAGTGVDASKLGTAKTSSGALQITYGGKPLYWSSKDTSSSQLHAGKSKFGTWSAVVLSKSSSGGGSTSTTSGGNGGVGF